MHHIFSVASFCSSASSHAACCRENRPDPAPSPTDPAACFLARRGVNSLSHEPQRDTENTFFLLFTLFYATHTFTLHAESHTMMYNISFFFFLADTRNKVEHRLFVAVSALGGGFFGLICIVGAASSTILTHLDTFSQVLSTNFKEIRSVFCFYLTT